MCGVYTTLYFAHALNSAFCAARAAILASIAARTAAASSSSTPSGTCSGMEAGAIAGAASGGEANTSAAGAGAAPKATRDGAEVGLRGGGVLGCVLGRELLVELGELIGESPVLRALFDPLGLEVREHRVAHVFENLDHAAQCVLRVRARGSRKPQNRARARG